MEFEVLFYKPLPDPTRPLRGFVDVLIKPYFIVRGVRHIHDSNNEYVEFPVKWAKGSSERNGKQFPYQLFEFVNPEDRTRFKKEVLEQIHALNNDKENDSGNRKQTETI